MNKSKMSAGGRSSFGRKNEKSKILNRSSNVRRSSFLFFDIYFLIFP